MVTPLKMEPREFQQNSSASRFKPFALLLNFKIILYHIVIQKLQKWSIKDIFGYQLKVAEKLTIGCTPIQTTETEGLLVQHSTNKNYVKIIKYAEVIHSMISISKGLLFVNAFKFNDSSLTAFHVIQFQFWICPFVSMLCLTNFLRRTSTEFVQFFNVVFNLDNIASSYLIKAIVVNSLAVNCVICLCYLLLILFSNIDPIAYFMYSALRNKTEIYMAMRTLQILYEIWSFTIIYNSITTLLMAGMFGGYVALWKIAKQFTKSASNSNQYIEKDLMHYQTLRMYTKLSNNCYQDIVSIAFKIMFMKGCVLCGACLIESKLRSTASVFENIFFVYVLVNLYCYIVIAYSVPGVVNSLSERMLQTWKKKLTRYVIATISSRRKFGEIRRSIKACPDIRIMFGAVNFYDKTTWVHILHLVISYTINLVLMF